MKREKQINIVVRTLYLLKYAFTSKLLYRFTGYDNVTNYFCSAIEQENPGDLN